MLFIAPYPPPNDGHLAEATPEQLMFQWSPIDPNCQIIQYRITAVNCGTCPNTTFHTSVTCRGVIADGRLCSFAIQAVVCNNIASNMSLNVQVILKGKYIIVYIEQTMS